jgi:hypothetical protein
VGVRSYYIFVPLKNTVVLLLIIIVAVVAVADAMLLRT